MARKTTEKNEAVKPAEEQRVGSVFIKNHTNEIVVLPDGTELKFKEPRMVVFDEPLKAQIREVASKYGIICVPDEEQ